MDAEEFVCLGLGFLLRSGCRRLKGRATLGGLDGRERVDLRKVRVFLALLKVGEKEKI